MVNTNLAPYFDDFDQDRGFHRLLFQPSRSVQARELTQMQTILQNQIARFGQNIFLEGTVVIPGGVTIDTNYEYVRLQNSDISGIFSGATIVGNSSGMIAELIQKVDEELPDPATLYIRYTGGGSSGGGRFQDGETLTFTNLDTSAGSFTAETLNATGTGTKVNLDRGVYFVKGFFVVAITQSLILEKYGIPTGTQEVGLISEETIITSAEDSSLLSNAQGTNNVNAPGADRLKYALTLVRRQDIEAEDGSVDVDYFTIARVQDAVIVEALTRTQYNLLGEELARRTFDESGHYTVDPFIGRVDEHPTDETKLNITLDPGRAYVRGFEVDRTVSSVVVADRALTTQTDANARTPVVLGNYVRTLAPSGLPDVSNFEEVDLVNDAGLVIGSARVRYISRENSSIYRFYLFQVTTNLGNGFNQVRTITNGTFSAVLVADNDTALSTNSASLKDTFNNNLLFSVPRARARTLQDITVRAQRYTTFTTDADGNVTLDTGSSTVTWSETSNWIIVRIDTGAIVTAGFSPAGSQTINLSGLESSTQHSVIGFVDKTSSTTRARTKTLTQVNDASIAPEADNSVLLQQSDIFELQSIIDVSNGENITDRYILDNGQRDNLYNIGKLILRTGQTAPTGNVEVSFNYFAHGTGDYFNIDSYNSLIDDPNYTYGDIPSYIRSDGSEIPLSDFFDFRPRINNTRDGFIGPGSAINEIPQINETIQADVTYFLPRVDVLYINRQGDFNFAKGAPALNPESPQVPANVMPIYEIFYGAGTISETDVELNFINNRRYTMRDIADIEDRVSTIEEWTTLSLLESNTDSLEVLDAEGNNRFKSGFFVDSFQDHRFTDTNSPEYSASINPEDGILRASFDEYNTRLVFKNNATDLNTSTNVRVSDDILTLNYTEKLELSQPLASSAINVNPYAVILGIGKITLSPESDEWRDVVTETVNVNSTRTPLVPRLQIFWWDAWRWNWAGRRWRNARGFVFQGFNGVSGFLPDGRLVGRFPGRRRVQSSVEVTSETRTINVTLLPFIRSRKVYFRMEGLLPNTRHRPLFDDVDVSDWCREEPYVQVATMDAELNVSNSASLTSHPEGESQLVSDSQGEIEGSFYIPNTSNVRFRSGRREFKVRDWLATTDDNSLSSAFAPYTAQGTLETRQRTVTTIRTFPIVRPRRIDPVAQSFVIENDTGAFVTSIDTFFKTKSNTIAVRCQIRTMENGLPTNTVLPGAEVFVRASDVNISNSPNVNNNNTLTKFTFPSPIYLEGRREYAIVVLAETTDYEIWTGVTTEFVVGSTVRRITKQPSLGSFFKSQNGSTWTPDQSRDLMFQVNRANFDISSNGTAFFESTRNVPVALATNPLEVITVGPNPVVRVFQAGHAMQTNGSVEISGASSLRGISAGQINGTHVVTSASDYDSYTILVEGASATSTGFGGGASIRASQQFAFDIMFPNINELNIASTSTDWSARTTSGNSPTEVESPFIRSDYEMIMPGENNVFSSPRLIASPINEINQLGSQRSLAFRANLNSSSNYVSPIIDLNRLSANLIRNRIDNQSATQLTGFNVPSNFVEETDSISGSALAKHITSPVTLTESAIGLTVLFGANRPPDSFIDLYYRTTPVGSNDTLMTMNWIMADIDEILPTDDDSQTFREYRYTIPNGGLSLEPFNTYQFKIVFRSRSTSRVPVIRDFRAIALAT